LKEKMNNFKVKSKLVRLLK